MKRLAMMASLLIAGAGCIAPAAAQSGADFYKGRQLTIMVGFPPGGGYDIYARVLARHISGHIPGAPTIVVQNMPGAGSLNLANHIYSVAPKDGTVMGSVVSSAPFEYFYDGQGVRFDPLKFAWIGGMIEDTSTCGVWHTSPAKQFLDLQTHEAPFAGTGPAAPPEVESKVSNDVLGTKMKLILGYRGLGDVYAAIEKGELEGSCGITWSSVSAVKTDWIRDGKWRTLVQIASKRHKDLPDVPLLTEFARNDADRKLLELVGLPNLTGRPYMAPPETPADRVAILRKAFSATLKDAAFLKDANQAKLPIDPVSAERIEQVLSDAAKMPKDVIARMSKSRQ
ncbi:MAG: tripartite tricarboxylate transporter substrate-binding protein [Beijerinckiaceae bacterium]|nr:tripartite tricarboxylate transporter substrate-binding protein [Beijerinckiaceae bacterium]